MSDSVPEYVDPDDEPTTKYVTETGANLCGACDGTGELALDEQCRVCAGYGEVTEEGVSDDAYEAYCERMAEDRETRDMGL